MAVSAVEFRDIDQNRYYISVDGYCFIELNCETKRRIRRIARIFGDEIVKKENGHGIHRKTMSFGFPYELLKQAQLRGVKQAVVIFNGAVFITDVEKFFSKGFVLFFKERVERRIFLPMSEFKQINDARYLQYYELLVKGK
ncbi:hypothetical protein SAMN06269117_11334 [Balnearium lithotrophicum]|uniref:Uncharacterized protein n=1 Tax=Balnearium lithotrophicum TaxID=223788 RepID=A0A521CJD9_9BACT|nr:hypothetical protein [Balnearium lithotrophicum]SMO59569.1 hypothetical protein SAMN06269117_11334 [Balnearium lithotrophicum]